MHLVPEANVNAVLTEELFHFQLPAANIISVPVSKAFPPFVLGRTAILGYEHNDGFKDISRASFPCWEGGGR
jgi:hypothetical protein